MDPRIGSLWLIATCVGIVMISCYISGVACDVPDDVVYTDLHKAVRIGDSAVLKCQFRGTPLTVYWKKGGDPERSPTLVSWITGDPVTGVCVGERVCLIMEMNAEFSLIIKEVSIVEQGLYLCRVANYKGIWIHNFTDITVFSPPKEPYPIINECQIISPTETETPCTIPTNQSVEISCSASGYYPDIDLYFLHGTTRLHTKDTIEVANLDGTKNKTIYANATASEISYTCFAPIPGSLEQRTTTVLVTGPTIPIDRRDGSVAKVVVPVIIVLAVICISIILWRRRRQQRGQDKSELTDEDLKEFALSITKRHCQKLGKPFKLSAGAIANRNAEDLEMFRTDIMLKAWVLDQECSNHEIRRRLRQAAEQCNRQDIADIFIRKEQSEVMTSTVQLTITNEEQNPGVSRSENDVFIRKEQSEVMTSTVQLTITNENQSPGVSRSENVTSISRDELNRIGCYAGSAVLLAFCKKYDVTVPEQQSPDGKEFLCEIINVLKPTLDSEFERIKKEKKSSTPRKTLRKLLEKEHPRYACLLAMKKPFNIFDVELIDLAFRLIMADVYPFAKALNISDQVLNSYRRIIRPSVLSQGTANIIKQVSIKERGKMITPLKQAGYSEEARALYFGFEISLGDVIEVEKRVNMAQLAKQLGISDDVQSTGPGSQVKPVLLKWRDTVHSSTFNHRLVLADALFRMGEEQLALDIISGVHRNRVINEPMLELLAATVPEGDEVPTFKVMDQKTTNEEKGLVWSAKSPTESSNKLLADGCYAFAYENMAVFHHGTDTGNVASEELRQGGSAINKPGKKGDKKKKEGMEKSTNGDTLIGNTRKEGTRKGLEQVAKDTIPTEGMQEANTTEEGKGGSQKNEDKKSSGKEATDTNNLIAEISREENNPSLTNEEEVMQEKSEDGAAESKENITENIDTEEQGNTPDGLDE